MHSIQKKDNSVQRKLRSRIFHIVRLSCFMLICITLYINAIPDSGIHNEPLQNKTITGRVVDEEGNPLPSVNILIKNTQSGTMANPDGTFTITAPNEQAVLVFSYIGFITQEVPVRNQTVINVRMIEDSQMLEEIVVVGYGTRVRGALTGSVSKTDSKVFESRPIVGTVNALQGAMPGVTVIRSTTRPGYDDMTIQVRGISSINGSSPLILIDGIASDLNLLNPGDIEDITVLKDASASIYGARAADGVIIVSTKKGKTGKPMLSYSTNFGVKIPHFLTQVTTTSQMIDMYQEAKTNMGLDLAPQYVVDLIKSDNPPTEPGAGWLQGYTSFPGFYGNHDWNDMIYGTGTQQMHNIKISGGTENMTYLVSGGMNRDGGFFNYGDRGISDRYNIAANNSFKNIWNRLDVDTRIQFDSRRTNEPNRTGETIEHTAKMWRFIPMYNPAGNYYMWEGYQNPAHILESSGTRYMRNDRFTFNVKGTLNIIQGLKLVGQYGVRLTMNENKVESPTYIHYDWDNGIRRSDNVPNSVNFTDNYDRYSSVNAYLEYTKSFVDKHNISLMVGASHEEDNYSNKSATGRNLSSNDLFQLSLADMTAVANMSIGSNANDWAITSYFGRIGYNYDMKYMIDVSLRSDGSSRFAPDKRWSALFPAVSAAWNLGNESFIKSLNIFNSLKFRISWGQSGNQQGIGRYDYIPLVNISNNAYPFGSPLVQGAGATSSIVSQERTWETVTVTNAGIDFSVLRSRLSGSFEIYKKINSDMLVNQDLPALFGGSAPSQNIGELETKGFELSLGWRDRINDFSYSVSFILSDATNKLVSLKGSATRTEGLSSRVEGYPTNSYFGYKSLGIIKTQAQLDEYKQLKGTVPANIGIGDMMYADLDGDGQITAFGSTADYDGDLIYLGNRNPRYTYSSRIDLGYKNFDLGIILQGVGKRQVIRTGDFESPFRYYWFQPLSYYYEKTWTVDRQDAQIPRIIEGSRGWDPIRNWNYRYSDSPHRLINTAYMRVKVLTLGYTIPQSICNKLKMQQIRFYASGEDLFTFAKGTWGGSFDPEEGWAETGVNTFPFHKTISFGLDVKF